MDQNSGLFSQAQRGGSQRLDATRAPWRRLSALAVLCLLCSACILDPVHEREGLYEDTGALTEDEIEQVEEDIQALDNAARMDRDPDAEADFWNAVQSLTNHGAVAEPYLLEALAGDPKWAVRYGTIHVLDSVGTRDCVEPLIRVLDDEHYLVSFKAVHTLRVLTDHRIIPESADNASPNGLPPVPAADPDDYQADAAIQPWIRWHLKHGMQLRDQWLEWWSANGSKVGIE